MSEPIFVGMSLEEAKDSIRSLYKDIDQLRAEVRSANLQVRAMLPVIEALQATMKAGKALKTAMDGVDWDAKVPDTNDYDRTSVDHDEAWVAMEAALAAYEKGTINRVSDPNSCALPDSVTVTSPECAHEWSHIEDSLYFCPLCKARKEDVEKRKCETGHHNAGPGPVTTPEGLRYVCLLCGEIL